MSPETGIAWMELLRDGKFLCMTCGSIIAVVAIVASQIRRGYAAKVEADLKRDLVSRGRSVDEIERIINAKAEHNPNMWEVCGLFSQPGRK